MNTTTLIKYWVSAVLAIGLAIGLFMLVPTAIEANAIYQTTKQIDKVEEMIEYNSNKWLELEKEKERLAQKNKELRQEKQQLQNELLGEEETTTEDSVAFTK